MPLRARLNTKLKAFEKQFVTYNNIYVSRSAILHNFDLFQAMVPDGYVIPVLKSNAYGHGLQEVASILKARKFPYLAVDGYFEALRIHEVSRQPVLLMGAINPVNFKRMKFGNDAIVVHEPAVVEALGKLRKPIKVHVEIETGMGRHGVRPDELPAFLALLKKYPKLLVEGVMTHLADADNPKRTAHVQKQVKRFDKAVEQVRAAGFGPKYLHIAQSAGSTKAHSHYANTLRVGIALYGITPLDNKDKYARKLADLQPALTLESTIAKVLKVDPGESVGYGCRWVAKRPSRIGVLPLGYYEGLPRALSNVGVVKYGHKYLPITGRVCMNHTMIDLTDSKAGVDEKVVVISPAKNDKNSLDSLAREHGLFNYGLLVGLNQNIRRSITEQASQTKQQ